MGRFLKARRIATPFSGLFILEDGTPLDVSEIIRLNRLSSETITNEEGRLFSASYRDTVDSGASAYLEFRPHPDVRARIFVRQLAVNGPFNVDLVDADFSAGTTLAAMGRLNLDNPAMPQSGLYVDPSNVTNEDVLEYGFIPAERGPQSSGAIDGPDAYRIFDTSPRLLKLTNQGSGPQVYNINVRFSEELRDA